MDLSGYLKIARRRWWLLALPTLLITCAAFVGSSLRDDEYRATAEVLLKPNDPNEGIDTAGTATQNLQDPDRYVAGQVSVIESRSLADAAAERLGISDPERLQKHVSAKQKGASNIVQIAATDADPATAARIANAYVDVYIENRRQAQVAGLQRAVDELQRTLNDIEIQVGKLSEELAKPGMNDATRALQQTQLDAAQSRFQTIYATQQQAKVNIALKRGEAELVESAPLPEGPASPKPLRDALFGLAIGILVALSLTLVAEQLDDRIRNRTELEESLGATVIGEVPADRQSKRNPDFVGAESEPGAPLAEAVRSLRTSLQFLAIEAPIARLVVTSSAPGEGKTTITSNLAATFAHAGQRTIVVSADLRKPRLDHVFGARSGGPGLSDVVSRIAREASQMGLKVSPGNALDPDLLAIVDREVDAALVPTAVANLVLMPAGTLPPNPSELLGSPVARAVYAALSARADLLVFDTPPVLAVTDALVLSNHADATLLVAASNQTGRQRLTRALRMLDTGPARMLGVVLNKVPSSEGYGYTYSYRSGYEDSGVIATDGGESSTRANGDKKTVSRTEGRTAADTRPKG